MKNNRFINSCGLSGFFALAGFGICALNFDITADTPEGCIIWMAELFAVCLIMGLLGLETELYLRRKRFVPAVKRGVGKRLICAVLLGVIIGAAGQMMYALEVDVEREKTDNKSKGKESQVVLLLDYSGSMSAGIEDEKDVTCRLIDGLDENTSLQVIAFSDTVEDRAVSELLRMTDDNKDVLKSFVRNIDIWTGGTNFDLPLERAYETLLANKKSGCRSVVVMLSDYEKDGYTLMTDIAGKIRNEGFELYSVRLTSPSSQQSDPNDTFMQYTDEDIILTKNSDGSLNSDELLEALSETVKGKKKGGISDVSAKFGEETLALGEEASVWSAIIRIIFFGLFSAAAGYIYYGFEGGGKLLINFATGIIPALLSLLNPTVGCIVLMFIGAGSFTRFEIEEEKRNV